MTDVYQDSYIYAFIEPYIRDGYNYDRLFIRNLSSVKVKVVFLHRDELRNESGEAEKTLIKEEIYYIDPGVAYRVKNYVSHPSQGRHSYLTTGFRIIEVTPLIQESPQPIQDNSRSDSFVFGSDKKGLFKYKVEYSAWVNDQLYEICFDPDGTFLFERSKYRNGDPYDRDFKEGTYFVLKSNYSDGAPRVYLNWYQHQESWEFDSDLQGIKQGGIHLYKKR